MSELTTGEPSAEELHTFEADPVHAEALMWVAAQLSDADRTSFFDGFLSRITALKSLAMSENVAASSDLRNARRDLQLWARSWVVSVKLANDPGFQKDVQQTHDELETGTADPTGLVDIRHLLGV